MTKSIVKVAAAFAFISNSMAGAAAEQYHVEISQDRHNEWTGFAELSVDAEGNVRGEMCIVRKEYVDHAASPRTLLSIPLSGRRSGVRIELNLPRVPGGPVAANGIAALDLIAEADAPREGQEAWRFGDRQAAGEDEGNPGARPASDSIRHIELFPVVEPAEGAQLARFLSVASRDDQVPIVSDVSADGEPIVSYVNLAVYEAFSREQAIAFERRNPRDVLFVAGLVVAIVDSDKLDRLQQALDALGDGARIMNLELKDCTRRRVTVLISVPPLLEFWYTRQLQRSGLVATAYPQAVPSDPPWTAPAPIRSALVDSAFRNSRIPMVEKYRRLWAAFEQRLATFATARQPEFRTRGTIVRRSGQPHIYMAELTGPALAVCERNRWERITIQAIVNPSASANGIQLSIQMSEGFFGRGAALPSDSRLRDNRITDGELERLQGILVSAMQRGSVPGVRCQR